MKRKIGKGLMIAGALHVLGAAGDSDTGRLTLEGVAMKVGIGIALFAVGYILSEKVKTPEQSSEAFTKKQIKVLNSKQDATSAYKINFNTLNKHCQPRNRNEVI